MYLTKLQENSRHRKIGEFILGPNFLGELDRIAQEHNVTTLSLRFMVKRMFESSQFRYQFEVVEKEEDA